MKKLTIIASPFIALVLLMTMCTSKPNENYDSSFNANLDKGDHSVDGMYVTLSLNSGTVVWVINGNTVSIYTNSGSVEEPIEHEDGLVRLPSSGFTVLVKKDSKGQTTLEGHEGIVPVSFQFVTERTDMSKKEIMEALNKIGF